MADTDLLFEAAAAASTPHLVFGADTTLRTIHFAVTMPAPGGSLLFEQEIPADLFGFAVTMAAPGGSISFGYDPNIPEYLQAGAGVPWRGASALGGGGGAAWRDAARLRGSGGFPWRAAAPRRPDAVGVPWQSAERLRPDAVGLPWQSAGRVRPDSTGLPWRQGDRLRPEAIDMPWRDAARMHPEAIDLPWRDGRRVRIYRAFAWRDGRPVALPQPLRWRDGRPVDDRHRLPWQHGAFMWTHGNNPWPPIVPPEPPACYEASADLVFGELAAVDGHLVFRCDYHAGGPPASVVVPIKRAYIVFNEVLLAIVGGPSLSPLSLSMALDVDSWTWRWSATLPAAELAAVDTGTPVEVVATINGVAYRLVIEQIGRERSFGRNEVRVAGRGRNAILDVLSGVHSNPADLRTAAQLMDDALLIGGDGWTVDFDLDDWLVPAGVWSMQGTAIAAMRTIAAAAGGYLQPHRTNTVVRVLPRYVAAPWDWGGAIPDIELPTAPVKREAIEWIAKAEYNRVFVSGTRDGILAQVTRTGTAGDRVAPMVTDALITAVEAGRQRGLAILGDTGRQQLVTLSLPVLPETGVIEPGKFIRYVDGATERVGVVRSTSVEARFPALTQTIGVETHA